MVYLVMAYVTFDGSYIMGVYTDKDKAEEAALTYTPVYGTVYSVEE